MLLCWFVNLLSISIAIFLSPSYSSKSPFSLLMYLLNPTRTKSLVDLLFARSDEWDGDCGMTHEAKIVQQATRNLVWILSFRVMMWWWWSFCREGWDFDSFSSQNWNKSSSFQLDYRFIFAWILLLRRLIG